MCILLTKWGSFYRIERRPHEGGRTRMFSQHQETLIVDMVRQNNAIRLHEIQQRIVEDNVDFEGINSVSLSTIDRLLQRNKIRMKQVYRVPFERNSERVKELRCQYVQVSKLSTRKYCVVWEAAHVYILLCHLWN